MAKFNKPVTIEFDNWEYVPMLGQYMRSVYVREGDGPFQFHGKQYSDKDEIAIPKKIGLAY